MYYNIISIIKDVSKLKKKKKKDFWLIRNKLFLACLIKKVHGARAEHAWIQLVLSKQKTSKTFLNNANAFHIRHNNIHH